MKGISPLISAAIYMGMAITAVTLVITLGMPQLNRMTESTLYLNARESMANLDSAIERVASEGKGSVRIIPLELSGGEFKITDSTNIIEYSIETISRIVSPRVAIQYGNLVIASNADVNASQNATHYVLQNSHIKLIARRFGSPSSATSINTSEIIQEIRLLDNNKTLPLTANATVMEFTISNNPSASSGVGYTTLEEEGTDLSKGNITAFVSSSIGDYRLNIILDSEADFLTIYGQM